MGSEPIRGATWLPKRIRDRVEATRRDLGMIRSRLILGQSPPALIERKPSSYRTAAKPKLSRAVKVTKVVRETPNAISIFVTEADGSPVAFKAGQFLSVDVTVAGRRFRRAYSLAGPAIAGEPTHITVKRMPSGRVSNFFNDTIAAGQELQVLGPSGAFTLGSEPCRTLVLIAGGSGITPIASLLQTALEKNHAKRAILIYGNSREEEIIFRHRLAELAQRFGERFHLDHVLQHAPDGWAGGVGLLDPDTLKQRLQLAPDVDLADAEFYVCGPTPMMDAARACLKELGVPKARHHEELFVSPERRQARHGSGETQTVGITLNGSEHLLPVPPGQTILEAAQNAGIDMPFSCAMGGCGACRVRRVDGDIEIDEPNCLTPEERDAGYVLTCVGRPLSQCRLEVAP